MEHEDRTVVAHRSEAERSAALMEAFIATVSHEVRTPLNVILGFTELIEEDYTARFGEINKLYFDSIREARARLIGTLDLLLTISSVAAGSSQPLTPAHEVRKRDLDPAEV